MKSPHGKTGSKGASTIGEVLQRPDYEDEIVLYDGGPLAPQDGWPADARLGHSKCRTLLLTEEPILLPPA